MIDKTLIIIDCISNNYNRLIGCLSSIWDCNTNPDNFLIIMSPYSFEYDRFFDLSESRHYDIVKSKRNILDTKQKIKKFVRQMYPEMESAIYLKDNTVVQDPDLFEKITTCYQEGYNRLSLDRDGAAEADLIHYFGVIKENNLPLTKLLK